MAKKSSGWDGDDDDDADESGPDDFELEGWDDDEPPEIDLPSWEDWFDYDWDAYDGEYEEFAVSADYNGE